MRTVPQRFREVGDPGAAIDDSACRMEPLLELSERQKAEGLDEAPYPPHFPKAEGEPPRAQPSKRRREPTQKGQGRWSLRRRSVDE